MYLSIIILTYLGQTLDAVYYAYSLILICWENKHTLNVLGSVIIHIDQVIATIALSFIILYWYAVFAFNASWKDKYNYEGQMVSLLKN